MLTIRTEMRASAADGDLLDGSAAGGARLTCAVVDAEVLLMVAVAALAVAVVSEGRAAVGEAVAEDVLEDLRQQTPIERLGTPEDVAQAMAYLADAAFVTGQVLPVNGGFVIT